MVRLIIVLVLPAFMLTGNGAGHALAQTNDTDALDQPFRALCGQGKYAEAAAGERLLKLIEQTFGPNHPATAATLNNIAIVYENQGQYEEALKAYTRALAIKEKALGPDHLDVATAIK